MSRPLRVTFLCSSDMLGGAAIVTTRLMEALRREGVDARMVVFSKMSHSENVRIAGTRFGRGLRFGWERGVIYLNNGFNRADLFKVSIANAGLPLWRHPWVRQADVLNLSWINQGLLSLGGIKRLARLGKPIVWTMHDMWCMTGVCHHAYSCTRYADGGECGLCPQLHSRRVNDLSRRTWLRKQRLYAHGAPTAFVAVSNWLADRARASTLLAGADVHVIPNAFPVDEFFIEPIVGYPSFDPMLDRRRIIFGAARIDDPIKGLDRFIDTMNLLFDNRPDLANDTGVIFFGSMRNPSALDRLRFPYLNLGQVTDRTLHRQIFASGCVVASTSFYETLPSTLIEGQAAGCVPVTFGNGGQADIVDHLKTGYIARDGDINDFAHGIEWALSRPIPPQTLHDTVAAKFSADIIARRYLALYRSLL